METVFDANFALVRDDLLNAFGVARGGFDKFNTFGITENAAAASPAAVTDSPR
jgi:hypothetical protein